MKTLLTATIVLFFAACATSGYVPDVNCNTVTYVTFSMPGSPETCSASGALILEYGRGKYPLTCGSTVSLVFEGKTFALNGDVITIPDGIQCDQFGAMSVLITRRRA